MRKAGGLAGVGEGKRGRGEEGKRGSTLFPQNSIDKRFKTALFLPTKLRLTAF